MASGVLEYDDRHYGFIPERGWYDLDPLGRKVRANSQLEQTLSNYYFGAWAADEREVEDLQKMFEQHATQILMPDVLGAAKVIATGNIICVGYEGQWYKLYHNADYSDYVWFTLYGDEIKNEDVKRGLAGIFTLYTVQIGKIPAKEIEHELPEICRSLKAMQKSFAAKRALERGAMSCTIDSHIIWLSRKIFEDPHKPIGHWASFVGLKKKTSRQRA